MPEFLQLVPPREALKRWIDQLGLPGALGVEQVPSQAALGRVTAKAVLAPHPLPAFPRSTVDGYAVRAADTYGASEGLPAFLAVAGEVLMGSEPGFSISRGQCALIHTGGMLPLGCDAVVMVEHIQPIRPGEIEVSKAVAQGENVLKVGEDVGAGEVVIPAGRKLRPAEIGGLLALGLLEVPVWRKPCAAILSSGDEVIPPQHEPRPGQVRDINSYALAALIEQAGGTPCVLGIVPDQAEALFTAASQALEENDLVVITAGSSASVRDLTAEVIQQLGQPGVLVHGVNVRPGKPTILAVCQGKPVIGLPGNPVSALVIAGLFVRPVVEHLLGLEQRLPPPAVPAVLTLNLPSQAGREDWVPVRLISSPAGWQADPVFGKSNLIFSLAQADGMVRIPPDATGLNAGSPVLVELI